MAAASLFFSTPPPPPPRFFSLGATSARLGPSASSPPPRALLEIQKSGVIACLRADDGKLAIEAARAALNGGISILEVVMSTPGALEVLQELHQEFPSATIGVGTVLNAEDARKAIKSGAKFLMSPATVMEILFDVQGSDILYIPGVMTPTEVLSAYNAGARVVKVYPISVLGGDKYISVLKKPFPHIPMVVSQGITIDCISTYIERGALAVVLSDAIFEKEAMGQRNFGVISRFAHLASLEARQAGKKLGQVVKASFNASLKHA